MRPTLATIFASLLTGISASPITTNTSSQPRVRQLVEIPGVFVENIAVRPNGNLILNTISEGEIYSLDPSQENPEAHVVASIEGVNALTGITPVGKDVFAVAGSNLDLDKSQFHNGSMKIALVNFEKCGKSAGDAASVDVIIEGTDIGPVNGLTTLPRHQHIVLGADSTRGKIVRIDTIKGTAENVFQDDLLAPVPDPSFSLGVNGIRIFKHHLYFTNTARRIFGRVKIDQFGNKAGKVEIIAQLPSGPAAAPDDFVMDKHDNAYVTFWKNSLLKITPDGERFTVLEGDVLASPTSSALSRDGRKVYVGTAGQGSETVSGGQVVEVRL
ncbi:hypothetical protein CEP54_008929 [Fusarium duplospermum]|uniref:SMP-30/Gluconolactonase/LRE-like region domain-containing protein n=1 Tax=Fusarium duplospermum TaxID=1325734 RepID=A0A428PSZ5_9HYPO|nr:hypothetical protein CEP54_008929 [Fusarium duplospermum]